MEFNYECMNEECGFEFAIQQGFYDKPKKRCQICKRHTLERITIEAPLFFIKDDIKTVGQLAEKNAKKMGKEQISRLQKEQAIRARKAKEETVRQTYGLSDDVIMPSSNEHKPWYGKAPDSIMKHAAKADPKDNNQASSKKVIDYILTGKE